MGPGEFLDERRADGREHLTGQDQPLSHQASTGLCQGGSIHHQDARKPGQTAEGFVCGHFLIPEHIDRHEKTNECTGTGNDGTVHAAGL